MDSQNELEGTASVPHTLKARCVFPVASQPIHHGTVTIHHGRIVAVGTDSRGPHVEDLGNVAIIPGLVNAHTHLDFSELTRPLGNPGMGMADWIRRVIAYRLSGPARLAVQRGLQQCRRLGTTTLGEIAQAAWPLEQIDPAGLDVTVFLELIAPTRQRVEPALQLARKHLSAARTAKTWHPGISPHAPYSVHPELLAAAVSLSSEYRLPLAFHLAELREELEFLRSGGGPFRTLLEEFGSWDPGIRPRETCPLDYLRTLAPAHRTLVIHGNYLDHDEIAFLSERAGRMSVVYCPRTHARFGHDAYPLEKMLAAGVAVALGTDSRASSPDLSVLAEMRFVAAKYPGVDRKVVLELGTIRAAAALGRDREAGSLEPGKKAHLAVVALPDRDAADPYELLFDSELPVVARWYDGVRS